MDIRFQKHKLSDNTLEKLKKCEDLIKNDFKFRENTIWRKLFKIEEINDEKNETGYDNTIEMDECSPPPPQTPEPAKEECPETSSTQFYFTQNIILSPSQNLEKLKVPTKKSKTNSIIINIAGILESKNGILETEFFQNLSDIEVVEVVEGLSKELTTNGIFHLCKFICEMEKNQAAYWIRIICTKLLLQKIIDLDKLSKEARIICLTISKISQVFPEDIQNLIFAPMINLNLENTTVIEHITKSSSGHQKINLISTFITHVKNLQPWHISLLTLLIDIKIDNEMKDALLTLLVDKANEFSKDQRYSKFIMKFIKSNSPFSEKQKNMLNEILTFNKTIFALSMKNVIENLYLYQDLWYISS